MKTETQGTVPASKSRYSPQPVVHQPRALPPKLYQQQGLTTSQANVELFAAKVAQDPALLSTEQVTPWSWCSSW